MCTGVGHFVVWRLTHMQLQAGFEETSCRKCSSVLPLSPPKRNPAQCCAVLCSEHLGKVVRPGTHQAAGGTL
jgi:hypothetical protein